MLVRDLTPALVLGGFLLLPKAVPPCAARIECEVGGSPAACSPRLVSPAACGARAIEYAVDWEPVLESEGDYRVRLRVSDAATGELLSSPLGYLVDEGGARVLVADHPAILARPVAVHRTRFDAAPRSLSGSGTASSAATVTVQGRIAYEDFPVSAGGYLAPVTRAARGIDVVVESVDRSPRLAVSARTDSAGAFRVPIDVPSGGRVAVSFSARSAAGVVRDNLGTTYTWTTAGAPTTVTADSVDLGTVTVSEADDAGALNILDVIGSGYAYVITRGAPAPAPVTVTWKKGVQADGTFYDPGAQRISILNSGAGANDDTDEWDDQVIAHEYGHHIQTTTSCNLSAGGPWSICESKSPELAWTEGGANYLSLAVSTQDPQVDHVGALYLDSVGTFAAGSHVALAWDLESDHCSGAGGPSVPGVVSNFLWDLQDPANEPSDAFFRSETDLFRLFQDMRGEPRCDLTEFLVEVCRRDPKDLDLLGDLFQSYGLDRPTGCELQVRGPVAPPNRRRQAPGVIAPRSDAGRS